MLVTSLIRIDSNRLYQAISRLYVANIRSSVTLAGFCFTDEIDDDRRCDCRILIPSIVTDAWILAGRAVILRGTFANLDTGCKLWDVCRC